MKYFIFICLYTSTTLCLIAQDNCNVFLWNGDSCKYDACSYLENAKSWYQLTKEYHMIKDTAIQICPSYATPYRHKSTAYLKTGDFINFKKLIDKAVLLNPVQNLDYRGWCRFQFFRDYQGAINDIERLEKLTGADIGYCQNGDYHLIIAKGLCYKMLGERDKAIQIIKNQINLNPKLVGDYDYLHLGVLYFEKEKYTKAIKLFDQQSILNNLAENQYYKALSYKAIGDNLKYKKAISLADEYYLASNIMYDVYTHQVDKVYYVQIKEEYGLAFNGK